MKCSKCGEEWTSIPGKSLNFCPNCGESIDSAISVTSPDDVIKSLVSQYGESVLLDSKLLSLVADALQNKAPNTLRLIRLAIQEGIPKTVHSLKSVNEQERLIKISVIADMLVDGYRMETDAAYEVINWFTDALLLNIESKPTVATHLPLTHNDPPAPVQKQASLATSDVPEVGEKNRFGGYDWCVLDTQDDKTSPSFCIGDRIKVVLGMKNDNIQHGQIIEVDVEADYMPKLFYALDDEYGYSGDNNIYHLVRLDEDGEQHLVNERRLCSETQTIVRKPLITPEIIKANASGNTAGNIANAGLVASNEDSIFYNNLNDCDKLYTVYKDGTDRRMLYSGLPWYINVVGDLVFFSDRSDNYKIYSITINRAGKRKLNDDKSSYLNVLGDRIYYVNDSDDGKLYTIRIDGSDRKKLTDDALYQICVSDNQIYYKNKNDNNCLYTICTDGTGRKKISDDSASWINILNNRIYYSNGSDQGRIYTIRTDGSDRKKLSDNNARYLNVVGDRIYYSNMSDDCKLYTIRADGTDNRKLNNTGSRWINVVDEWLYYNNLETDGGKGWYGGDELYAIRTDGTDNHIFK